MRTEIERAHRVLPAGVSSPLRACRTVGTEPLVVDRAEGERLYDVDGRAYVDFMYGFGPLILGHSPAGVTDAIRAQAGRGTLWGTSCPQEVELAERIVDTAPYLEQLRFVCSGTEAVMSAVRMARAFTGRSRILRFAGGYHGHFDLVQNRDEAGMLAAGLDPDAMRSNLLAEYNDADGVHRLFADYPGEIAAVVVEPIACNMSLVHPEDGFLRALRDACDRDGALLVFDEVITGFRLRYGPCGVQLGVAPDLTAFGKVVGGGTPVGAFGGRSDVMRLLDEGRVLQGGTFSGNPLTMAAGLATLDELAVDSFYAELERKGELLENAIQKHRADLGVDFTFVRAGSVFGFVFVPQGRPVRNLTDVRAQSAETYGVLYRGVREYGYHLSPDAQEVQFLSAATSDDSIEDFARRACESIAASAAG